jgi:UDP-perosamine 4-acetyltransferase
MARWQIDKPIIVLGGAGHAGVVISALQSNDAKVMGFTDPDPEHPEILGVPHLGADDVVLDHRPEHLAVTVGIGARGPRRRSLFEWVRDQGFPTPAVVHRDATVDPSVEIGDGTQVMAGAVVQPGTRIEENVIINTNASVDHDCVIQSHAHVAPGCTLAGSVAVGASSFVGAGATVIDGRTIGAHCTVGAGAVVIQDVASEQTVVGVPATARSGR